MLSSGQYKTMTLRKTTGRQLCDRDRMEMTGSRGQVRANVRGERNLAGKSDGEIGRGTIDGRKY